MDPTISQKRPWLRWHAESLSLRSVWRFAKFASAESCRRSSWPAGVASPLLGLLSGKVAHAHKDSYDTDQ